MTDSKTTTHQLVHALVHVLHESDGRAPLTLTGSAVPTEPGRRAQLIQDARTVLTDQLDPQGSERKLADLRAWWRASDRYHEAAAGRPRGDEQWLRY